MSDKAQTHAYEEQYKNLNPEQKKAVDTVEGPVVVVAGPGTGKTHILTLRIAHILNVTQAAPQEILALTFTDSAAYTMRQRLIDIIGEETARKVTITTFHGFCEQVLKTYSESFGDFSERRLLGDVEQVLLWREVFDTSAVTLLRPPKAPYTYLHDVQRLYEDITREGVTLDEYRLWGEEKKKELMDDTRLLYVRGPRKGTLTKAGRAKQDRYKKIDEAIALIETYQDLKAQRGVYDFSDVLRVVIDGIRADDELRSILQETYQYILADEHQDTNALQHMLLELLAYDNAPNICVVGDEKQAIYRFQGADVHHFRSLQELFPRAKIIHLTSSYRSFQNVLDTAHAVIEDTGTHQRLQAVRKNTHATPGASRIVAHDPLEEEASVAALINERIAAGTPPHDIAVITRKNETADFFARYLEAQGVPVLRAGDVSLTSRPLVRYLVSLMEYVAEPTHYGAYRFALLAPWWDVPLARMASVLQTTSDKMLAERIENEFPILHKKVAMMLTKSRAMTPLECFSFIFATSGAREYILARAEHLDDVPLIRLLMMHLEEVSVLHETATFMDTLSMLRKAHEHGLAVVKQSVVRKEGMVSVITAHKAKGMEFQYVFVPDMTESTWERGGRPSRIPSPFEHSGTLDDARRLFYVALTRAKDHVYLSYAHESKSGREQKPSLLMPSGLPEVTVEAESLPLVHTDVVAGETVRKLTHTYLTTDGLSPTAVNEYLESPPTFFARRVLKMHEPPTGPLVVGSALHKGIATLLLGGTHKEAHAASLRVFARSLLPRDRVYEDLIDSVKESLGAFIDAYEEKDSIFGEPLFVETEFSATRTCGGTDVRMRGKVDAVCTSPDGAVLIDFKTGSSISGKDQHALRQLMLYAWLLGENGETLTRALLVQVTPNGIREYTVPVTPEHIAAVLAECDEVILEMLNGNWRRGSASEYDVLLDLA